MSWLFPTEAEREAQAKREHQTALFWERFNDARFWIRDHGSAKLALKHLIEAQKAHTVSEKVIVVLQGLAYAEDQGWDIPVKYREPD